jgi:hypothetical protein
LVQFPVDTINAAHGSGVTMVFNVYYVLLILAQRVTISSLHAPEPFVVREWFHRQLLCGAAD